MRYVKNNFFDGARQVSRQISSPLFDARELIIFPFRRLQDAFDLLTGAWNAKGLTEKAALDDIVADRRTREMRVVSSRFLFLSLASLNSILTSAVPLFQMPYILFFSALMLFASLVLPRQSREPRFLLASPLFDAS